jgi:DNA (cytosine-5)-methyltransferase 1
MIRNSDTPSFEFRSPAAQRARVRTGAKQAHRVVGLFAGIGGIERGLLRSGHHASLLCENEPTALAVLRERFASVPLVQDVRDLDRLPAGTTLVAAGFPCQDLSQAGKTAGIAGSRSGLVGEVFRLLRRDRAPWLLLENVPFMLQLAHGQAMEVITASLEELGYRWAYRVVDAIAFGLPQRRRRVYLVASLESDPREVLFADDADPVEREPSTRAPRPACGFYWTEGVRGLGWAWDAVPTLKGGSTIGIASPPAIWMPDGAFGQPSIRDAERLQGFPSGWTRPALAVGREGMRWKLVGNAVSVPVAAWIGRRLAQPGVVIGYPTRRLRQPGSWPSAAWNVTGTREEVIAGEWPVARRGLPLATFLRDRLKTLSPRATSGFLRRARSSTLRFPEGFIEAVEAHLHEVAGDLS